MFGYEPSRVYVLDDREGIDDGQRFRGASSDEVLEALTNGYLGFEYVNSDVLLEDRGGDVRMPVFQREAVPAEFHPDQEWKRLLEEVEEVSSSVSDSHLSSTIYNERKFRSVEDIEVGPGNTSFAAIPDIRGVHMVSYIPERREARLFQYSGRLEASPQEAEGGGAVLEKRNSNGSSERDEESIESFLDAHENWEISRETLPHN